MSCREPEHVVHGLLGGDPPGLPAQSETSMWSRDPLPCSHWPAHLPMTTASSTSQSSSEVRRGRGTSAVGAATQEGNWGRTFTSKQTHVSKQFVDKYYLENILLITNCSCHHELVKSVLPFYFPDQMIHYIQGT